MKIVALSLFVLSFFSAQPASAYTCEQWKTKLPARYASDFRNPGDSTNNPSSATLACGNEIGNAALTYVKDRGENAIILQLTAMLGIKSATTSLVMMTGYKVMAAYHAAQFVYRAFEKDAQCFYDHDFKRGMMEPVAHFYSPEMVEGWVQNLGCTQLGQMVHAKIQSVQGDIHDRQRRQREYDNYVNGRNGMEERAERMFPLESRKLTPQHLMYLEKRERMEKPVPLFDVATDLLPCLKPEALTRMACGLVVELGWAYLEKTSPQANGLDRDLKESLLRTGNEMR